MSSTQSRIEEDVPIPEALTPDVLQASRETKDIPRPEFVPVATAETASGGQAGAKIPPWTELILNFLNATYAQAVHPNILSFMTNGQEDGEPISNAKIHRLVGQWVNINGPAVWSVENRKIMDPLASIYPEDEEE